MNERTFFDLMVRGWMIMEAPAALVFVLCYISGSRTTSLTSVLFLFMWEFHYIHRAFIYPFTLRGEQKRMSVSVMAMAFFFNIINAYLNGRFLFEFSDRYGNEWMKTSPFLIGII